MSIVSDVQELLNRSSEVNALLGLESFENFAQLAGSLFTSTCHNAHVGKVITDVYASDGALQALSIHEINETARRNVEPGGPATALLFSRGVHAVMAHRVANKLWNDGNTDLALALKAVTGQALDTDIHPAATIGSGLWLDHGLGFVVGETCVIEEDVSIWHNVTLGSALNGNSALRHPHICARVLIGAGATVLGHIKISEDVNIGAGAIVLDDVPSGSLVVGNKATVRGSAKISFVKAE